MISLSRVLLLSCVVLTGCSVARDAVVTSFRILDTPASYIRRRIEGPETTTTTTTTQTVASSDVANPGRPVNAPVVARPRGSSQDRIAASSRSTISRPPRGSPTVAPRSPAPSPPPRSTVSQTAQFPTAKPVPGRPGYVYSIDPQGGIVDVTGYKPGDKAKDPYTQQIFIVP